MFYTILLILFVLIIPIEVGKYYIFDGNSTLQQIYEKDTINMNLLEKYIYDYNFVKLILLPKVIEYLQYNYQNLNS
jgi:hypothetical protein